MRHRFGIRSCLLYFVQADYLVNQDQEAFKICTNNPYKCMSGTITSLPCFSYVLKPSPQSTSCSISIKSAPHVMSPCIYQITQSAPMRANFSCLNLRSVTRKPLYASPPSRSIHPIIAPPTPFFYFLHSSPQFILTTQTSDPPKIFTMATCVLPRQPHHTPKTDFQIVT